MEESRNINFTETDIQNLMNFLDRVQYAGVKEASVIMELVRKLITKPEINIPPVSNLENDGIEKPEEPENIEG